jgi:hypothetical protein
MINLSRVWWASRALVVVAILLSAAASRAQDPDPQSAIQLDLRIGGVAYAISARGTCLAQPHGSLYDVPASQWTARHRDGQRYANLAFWRLASGGDMFNLGVLLGPTLHRVSTVKVQGKGDPHGSGRVTLALKDGGGTFLVDALADTGVRVTGSIACGAFTRPVEDNGD